MSLISLLTLLFAQASADPVEPFFAAIRNGDSGEVRALLKGNPRLAGAKNKDGATPALWAAYTRHPELAEIVLAGRAPDFFEACALGRPERAGQLLAADRGLIDAYSADGFTPLGLAVFFGHLEIARMLVNAGAEVDRPSRNAIKVAPLHSAVASGQIPLLELLLSHGASPDPVEFLGATPLHSAAVHGNREMAHRLLQAGANPILKTNEGKTAADLARQYGHAELAAELEAH